MSLVEDDALELGLEPLHGVLLRQLMLEADLRLPGRARKRVQTGNCGAHASAPPSI